MSSQIERALYFPSRSISDGDHAGSNGTANGDPVNGRACNAEDTAIGNSSTPVEAGGAALPGWNKSEVGTFALYPTLQHCL